MPNQLIVLDPPEVKKSAQEVLSESELSDSEFGYFGLGEIYFLERLKRAFSLTWSRIVWPIVTVIATAVVGIYSGVTRDSVWRGAVSGLIVLVVGLVIIFVMNWLFSAPKQMDEELRGNLGAAKMQILEERRKGERAVDLVVSRYRDCYDRLQGEQERTLKFELNTTASGSQVYLNRDNEEELDAIPVYHFGAHLLIRYHNDDTQIRTVRNVLLSLVTVSGDEYPLTTNIVEPTLHHPGAPNASPFTTLMVQGSETTVYYVQEFLVAVPPECANLLKDDSFLRIAMDATRQERSFKDFAVNWGRAREGNVSITLRGA